MMPGITIDPLPCVDVQWVCSEHYAHLSPNICVIEFDPLLLPFQQEAYEHIILPMSLDLQRSKDDQWLLIQECCRVLAPGGRIDICQWRQKSLWQCYRQFRYGYTVPSQRKGLSKLSLKNWASTLQCDWIELDVESIHSDLSQKEFALLSETRWSRIQKPLSLASKAMDWDPMITVGAN